LSAGTAARRSGRAPWLVPLGAFIAIVGSVSTALWIGAARLAQPRPAGVSGAMLAALLGCLGLTSLNLALRWFRWHFLIRRFTRRIVTRDSVAVYLATLPAILTPFFVGELCRVLILRRRSGARAAHLTWVWLIERTLDAAVLLVFFLLTVNARLGLAFIPLVAGGAYLLFRRLLAGRGAGAAAAACAVALLTTVAAWLLPVAALLATVSLLGHAPIAFAVATKAFSAGTLSGGASGFPLGVFITGSTMIEELLAGGVAAQVGVLSVLVYRIGTAWYAVSLGVASFFFFRRRLAALMRAPGGASAAVSATASATAAAAVAPHVDHFDDIAHAYEEQIPRHIRERLLAKKTGLIRRCLDQAGIGADARGLDLGCGQGWYLAELSRAGYRMHGIDYSVGQLRRAAAHQAREGLAVARLAQADAQELPFPDGTFDFAYSINAFHHLPTPEAQARAAREIVRVLRPGGAFVLHEMNTHNPVFRLYMGYLFPLVKEIDEGTEHWILPSLLPAVPGAAWQPDVQYFTFTPDFVPGTVQTLLDGVERALERSAVRRYSAHYQACLVKQRP
jgi:SAM-dependent methyltransferase